MTFRATHGAGYADILCFAQVDGDVYGVLQELFVENRKVNVDLVVPHMIPFSDTRQFLAVPAALPLVKCVRVLNCLHPT